MGIISNGNTIIDNGAIDANEVDTTQLAADAVETAKIADAQITLAKLSATGTKDATTFLRGDNTFAEAGGGGIENAQTWRLTGNASQSSNGFFGGSWEQDDTTGSGSIGTALTNSSGTFSFPSTGYWLIIYVAHALVYGNSGQSEMSIYTTTNNSTYTERGRVGYGHIYNAVDRNTGTGTIIFDVTNTTNDKFKFYTQGHGENTRLLGDTNKNFTHFTVIRLGDT